MASQSPTDAAAPTKRLRRTRRRDDAFPGAPTLRDVAAAAGVSTATVSRALNSPHTLSPTLLEQVGRVVVALGYVPNGAGRALASLRTGVVGVIVPCLGDGLHDQLLAALEEALHPSGYTLALALASEDALPAARKLLSLGVEAIACIGVGETAAVGELAHRRGTPWVVLDADEAEISDRIGLDLDRGAETIVRYLHGLGHRRFALLADPSRAQVLWRERGPALQRALAKVAGVSAIETSSRPAGFDGAARAASALMRLPTPPTAIVCTDDETAAGAVKGCEIAGVSVPRDVSVTGFGDAPSSRYATPSLTTLRLPVAAAGWAAAQRLRTRIQGNAAAAAGPAEPPQPRARLFVRGSSAAPPPN